MSDSRETHDFFKLSKMILTFTDFFPVFNFFNIYRKCDILLHVVVSDYIMSSN